jgi:hypothetical protein
MVAQQEPFDDTLNVATLSITSADSNTPDACSSPYCCMFSTDMRPHGFPEVLAVDVEPEGRNDAKECLQYVARFMLDNQVVPKHLLRWTLSRNVGPASYFATLRVTDPDELDAIHQHIMGGTPPRPSNMNILILLMPIVPRSRDNNRNGDKQQTTASCWWGQIPPAPESRTKLRDGIKEILERQKASPCGFVRFIDGNVGNLNHENLMRVKLSDALDNPKWTVDWGEDMKRREAKLMKKYAGHFLGLSIEGVEAKTGAQFVSKLCQNADRLAQLYEKGEMLVDRSEP